MIVFKRNLSTNIIWEQVFSTQSKLQCLESMKKFKSNVVLSKDNKKIKYSAVLIPIVKENNNYSLLYTLRSSQLANHKRQVSFPGGNLDTNDKSYEDCALRETEEEIGIHRNNVDVWGETVVFNITSRKAIMPVIGYIKDYEKLRLKINSSEVEKVFTVPIEVLCSKNSARYTQFRDGLTLPAFLGGEEKIWGITAAITYHFLKALLPKENYFHHIKFIKYTDNKS